MILTNPTQHPEQIPARQRMTVNQMTQRGYRKVLTGYACYYLSPRTVGQQKGWACFKAGNVFSAQSAWLWINGDDTVELLHLKMPGYVPAAGACLN